MLLSAALLGSLLLAVHSSEPGSDKQKDNQKPRDPAAEVLRTQAVPTDRPEQKLTEHDRSDAFDPMKPAPPVIRMRFPLSTAASLAVEEIAEEQGERLRVVEVRHVTGSRNRLEARVR